MSTIYDWMKDGSTSIPNILFNRFGQLGLSSDEMVLVLYILSQMNQRKAVNNFQKISNQLGWSVHKTMELMNELIEKECLSIELERDENGKQSDHYTLRPFFNSLDSKFYQKKYHQKSTEPTPEEIGKNAGNLVTIFEREFGRVLTPLELQTISQWLNEDKYSSELVQLALKQAMMHQALSLSYIDKILLNWQKQNIKTPYEAQRNIDEFNQRRDNKGAPKQQTSAYDHLEIPLFEWNE
ncbi:DnaD domain protein [Aerococcaceae bacterium DSM 111176]|nr:DnaD domain protein [Aerococcaceae bacterium DSM 111176]